MNVEAYRKTIHRRVIVMSVLGTLYAAAMVIMHLLDREPSEFALDFLLGAISALVTCFVLLVPRYRKALRDEQALRRLWNREHDERLQAIKARAGIPMLLYTSLAMIAGALLIAPWNMTVAVTLLVTATAQLIASVAVKLICMRMM